MWTAAIPNDSVDINLGKGTASLHFSNIPVLDAFTVHNSLTGGADLGPPVPATILSVDIEWSGVTRRLQARNEAETYSGVYVENTARIAVTAITPGKNFQFVSDPASTVTNFAEIGQEHNGIFFR